jgi:hypothetical protein
LLALSKNIDFQVYNVVAVGFQDDFYRIWYRIPELKQLSGLGLSFVNVRHESQILEIFDPDGIGL